MVVQEEASLEFKKDVLAFAENPLGPFASERFGRDILTG
jgi:hypothetical protein